MLSRVPSGVSCGPFFPILRLSRVSMPRRWQTSHSWRDVAVSPPSLADWSGSQGGHSKWWHHICGSGRPHPRVLKCRVLSTVPAALHRKHALSPVPELPGFNRGISALGPEDGTGLELLRSKSQKQAEIDPVSWQIDASTEYLARARKRLSILAANMSVRLAEEAKGVELQTIADAEQQVARLQAEVVAPTVPTPARPPEVAAELQRK